MRAPKSPPTLSPCSVEGCEKSAVCRGWCSGHYRRWRLDGDVRADVPSRGWRTPAIDRYWGSVDQNGPVPDFRPDLGPCWVWRRKLTPKGYARFTIGRRGIFAHVFAYTTLVGSIPDGLVIDHLCRVRHCSNPAHLEPVPALENVLRGAGGRLRTKCAQGHPFVAGSHRMEGGRRRCLRCEAIRSERRVVQRQALAGSPGHIGGAAINTAKTNCPRGHGYTEENTRRTAKGRLCATCHRDASREYERRKAAEKRELYGVEENRNRAKTHCPKGHAYDEVNTYHRGTGRACRACAREHQRNLRATRNR